MSVFVLPMSCLLIYGGSTSLLGISDKGLGSIGSTAETASPLIMIHFDSEDPGPVLSPFF